MDDGTRKRTFSESELGTVAPLPPPPPPHASVNHGKDGELRMPSPPGLDDEDDEDAGNDSLDPLKQIHRNRPIRSCTHCRQQKIRCDASQTFPDPCTRCQRLKRECRVDPFFRPKKGGQVHSLRDDLVALRKQVDYLQERETALAMAVAKSDPNSALLVGSPVLTKRDSSPETNSSFARGGVHRAPTVSTPSDKGNTPKHTGLPISTLLDNDSSDSGSRNVVLDNPNLGGSPSNPIPLAEYSLGDISLSSERAEELHKRFMTKFLPYLPIMQSNSASELYHQSELLFWTVCLTASLSEPEPQLYNLLSGVIKQLAIETCWIRTPRSTHIVQALVILGNWPLPNEKVLDDASYRFIGLAKNLAMQLGLHRGEFMYEFSRTQVAIPDAEKWRTRTWLAIFLSEQTWSSILGLPPTMSVDFLVDRAINDASLPPQFRALVKLSTFYFKLVNVIGSSVQAVDGLVEFRDRLGTLAIFERELEHLAADIDTTPASVEIYYLYMKLMICCFAFLPPGANEVDISKYVVQAFHTATRIVTIISTIVEKRQVIEFPIYMRQAMTYAAFILFRLHLSPLLHPNNVESARQSVVTVHRLFRNMLTAWKDVQNDISRTAKVLENLNFVIITHPYLLTQAKGIITRMRSHLTASLFYELIWAVHEARRRSTKSQRLGHSSIPKPLIGPNPPAFSHLETVPPLPFYNQITRDDFITNTTTTPNGTTITTLVPAHPNATLQRNNAANDTNLGPPQPSTPVGARVDALPASPHPRLPYLPNPSPRPNQAAASGNGTPGEMAALLDSTGASNDPLHLDTLLQGIDWMKPGNGDDFLGWMDLNMKF